MTRPGSSQPHLGRGRGDVYWTKTATDAGLDLIYAGEAVVDHPSRHLGSLLGKMYRVGKGSVDVWLLDEDTTAWTIAAGLMTFPLKALRFLYGEADDTSSRSPPDDRRVDMTVGVYVVAALALSALALGRGVGILRYLLAS